MGIHFKDEYHKKYWLYKKKLQIKIVQNSIFSRKKKLSGRMRLSISGVKVGAPKVAIFEILEWVSKFTLVPNAVKNTDYIKKAANKN